MTGRSSLLAAAALLAIAVPVRAEDAAPQDHVHPQEDADIVVTASFARERFALPTAASVLEGDALARDMRSTIGETLASQPGVTASFFGPNASRPILRGMDAERVRVLTDGIGSFDMSNASADHAVAINPLASDRVEVVRGPAALLYGSSAIGGVVNMSDRRIPRVVPPEAVHLDLAGTLASAAKERSIAGTADLPLGETGLVTHVDGSFIRTGDYRAGGHIFSEHVREEAEAIGGEVAEEAQARGRVPNSDARTWDAGVGLGYVGSGGSFGIAVSHLESNYGIPNSLALDDDHDHDHDEGEEGHHGHEENIRIDMRQTRVDGRAEVPLSGGFETLKARFGWADYRHDEIEESGEIGTTFFNQGLEGRLELVQADRGGWKGASGVQYMHRRTQSVGEEAIMPLNLTDQFGIFTLQSIDLGDLGLEAGGRYENSTVNAPAAGVRRSFDAFSVSGGASLRIMDGWRLSGSIAWTTRAPSAEELLVDGAHPATRSYEIGDPDLETEKSLGLEAVLRGRGPGWNVELSGFFNRFSNYIFLAPTGELREDLPVYAYRQAGARYWGVEASGEFTFARSGDTSFLLTGLADFVRADILDGGGPVPRIPPFRVQGGAGSHWRRDRRPAGSRACDEGRPPRRLRNGDAGLYARQRLRQLAAVRRGFAHDDHRQRRQYLRCRSAAAQQLPERFRAAPRPRLPPFGALQPLTCAGAGLRFSVRHGQSSRQTPSPVHFLCPRRPGRCRTAGRLARSSRLQRVVGRRPGRRAPFLGRDSPPAGSGGCGCRRLVGSGDRFALGAGRGDERTRPGLPHPRALR